MATGTTPLVSVYIPTHNRPVLLRRAIESVLAQTYKQIEILVCDDGSSVDVGAIVSELAATTTMPIIHLRNEQPQGACVARNLGIERASGQYITGLDDDDIFHPDRIRVLVDNYDTAYSCICSVNLAFLKDTEIAALVALPTQPHEASSVSLDKLLYENFVGNQMLTETARLRAIGGFDKEMKAWQDYDTWVRLVAQFGAAKKLSCALYFLDEGHDLGRITVSEKRRIGAQQFFDKHKGKMSAGHRRSFGVAVAMMLNRKLSFVSLLTHFNWGGHKIWSKLAIYSVLGVKYKW